MSEATTPEAVRQVWQARVEVTLKPVVLDPQGDAVLHGLQQLGFADVSRVRVGKYLELTLAAATQRDAEAMVQQMCERLLANPVIESYSYSVSVEPGNPPTA
jgi:phosphoribosylformylglycinamidine synthase subunit PurS